MNNITVILKQKYDDVTFPVDDFSRITSIVETIGDRLDGVTVTIEVKEPEVEGDGETD